MSEGLPIEVALADEAATLALGRRLAALLQPGMYMALHGDLGAGKTTLTRGVLRGLGYDGRVKSPTYALVEVYKLSRLDLYHFDFYRFEDPRELLDAGLAEAFNPASVCIVEWPEKARGYLPEADLDIRLALAGNGRSASITPGTEAGKRCLQHYEP
jgi:tRNA threonylcarbamoyladenosine biosynthesis protein TsaE